MFILSFIVIGASFLTSGAVKRITANMVAGAVVLCLPGYLMLEPRSMGNSVSALIVWCVMAAAIWALLALPGVWCIDLIVGKALVGLAVFWSIVLVGPLTEDWNLSQDAAILASVGGSLVGLFVTGIVRRQLRLRKIREQKLYERVLRDVHERDRPMR